MSGKEIGTINELRPNLAPADLKRFRLGFFNRILDSVGLYDPYAARQKDNNYDVTQEVFEALVMTLTEPEVTPLSTEDTK